MYLTKFVHTKSGKILMSVILGFGLATLFRTVCKDKNCIVFKAPPMDEIDDKVYKFEGKCYKYKTTATKCDANKKNVDVE
jgi:hypothetical protein